MEQILTKYPFPGFLESRIGGRPENQDSFGYIETPDGLLVIVCDGMGGGPGGKTASSIAVEVIKQSVLESSYLHQSREEALKLAVERAHVALLNKMQEVPALKGMGTTIAALYINNESAVILHIGDSRIYKLRDGTKVFRTQDHSMVGDMVRNGTLTEEQARLSAQANIITRAIGIDGKSQADIDIIPFEKGDRFVLCSDGIWGAMPEVQLIKHFSERRSLANIVESMSNKVDAMGRDKGNHHDNLTLAMIETKIDSKLKEKMNRKAKMIIGAVGILLIVSLIFNMVQSCSKSKEMSRENEIEELEVTIQKKDSEIQAWKDSVEQFKQKEEKIEEKESENEKLIQQNLELKQRIEQLHSDLQKTPQKNEEHKTTPTPSNGPDTSSFNGELNLIIKLMKDLMGINGSSEQACVKSVAGKQKEITTKLEALKRKNPDKKEKLDELLIKGLDGSVGLDKPTNKYQLTPQGQNVVKQKIKKAQQILK